MKPIEDKMLEESAKFSCQQAEGEWSDPARPYKDLYRDLCLESHNSTFIEKWISLLGCLQGQGVGIPNGRGTDPATIFWIFSEEVASIF
ncbi:MAG: hypothetical protein NW237_17660 [Cyanobacteriota bacterium]|nr:hypothetical protein [Cyanobacteriota bacterium]